MMPRDGPKLEFTQGGVEEGLISGFAPIPQSSIPHTMPHTLIPISKLSVTRLRTQREGVDHSVSIMEQDLGDTESPWESPEYGDLSGSSPLGGWGSPGTPYSAPSTLIAVSPQDLWWCVLPSGQINVNVPRVLLPCHFRRAGSVCGSRVNVRV